MSNLRSTSWRKRALSKILHDGGEFGAVAEVGQRVAAAVGDGRRVGQHLVLQVRCQRVLYEREVVRIGAAAPPWRWRPR